jgi:Cu/Ag efflux protein CusF
MEKTMNFRQRLLPCLAAAWMAISPGASAQTSATDHAAHHGATTDTAAELASGEVRRIDKAQKKITLRHGEIRSLDMPPMSMVFQVREAELLDAVKVGDKVLFSAIKDSDGSFVVTSIKPAP